MDNGDEYEDADWDEDPDEEYGDFGDELYEGEGSDRQKKPDNAKPNRRKGNGGSSVQDGTSGRTDVGGKFQAGIFTARRVLEPSFK